MRNMLLAVLLLSSTPLYAEGPFLRNNEDGTYESAGNRQYQYDLNRPGDSVRYETDVRAQYRDQVNRLRPNPRAEMLEEAYGQRGGGLYRRKR